MRAKMVKVFGLAMVGLSVKVLAATPGLPFTENFADTNLCATTLTTANWSVEEQKLIQAFHASRRQSTHRDWTGANVTADTNETRSVTLGDVDGDGDLDLVAGNYGQANRLYLNNGTADPFNGVAGTDITSDTHSTTSVALGDVNGDGHLDLVAGNEDQANRLYLNNGTADPFNGVSGADMFITRIRFESKYADAS